MGDVEVKRSKRPVTSFHLLSLACHLLPFWVIGKITPTDCFESILKSPRRDTVSSAGYIDRIPSYALETP
jgi:hypothetical protein